MKQISEPHPPRAEFIHVEEEWHPCERAVSLRVVNTWLRCGDGGDEVYVTNNQETWVAGEQFCQRQGSHLVSFPQITACKSSLLSLLDLAEVHTSYTRLLDGLHYRDVANNLQLSDSVIDVRGHPDNCTLAFPRLDSPPEDTQCITVYRVVCGRNKANMEPSTVCGSYKLTYHSISFSADDANRTCRQRYGGWLLSTNMQQLSCVSQLLNSSQGLRDNNATTIPLYTSGTNGSAECEVFSPSRSAVLRDSCTAARPTVCVSRYCNGSDNLVAVRNEDRCQCRPGHIRTSAHSCSNILSTVGQDDSNITLFRWFESKWRVERVFTKQMVTQLANLSLPPGMFAFRSAGLIVYTFSTSLQPADTVVAELARNASLFLRVNASSGGTVLSTVGRSLSNFTVWFRRFNFKCYNATNITVSCSFSPFNQTLRFEDGLYEVAVSPHSSSVLSVPALYRIHPRPTSAPTLMTSLPYSSTSVVVPPSGGESTPSLFSSSPSSSNAPSPKGSMVGLFAGIGSAVALLVGLLILACVVLVRRRRKGGVNIQAQRTGHLQEFGTDFPFHQRIRLHFAWGAARYLPYGPPPAADVDAIAEGEQCYREFCQRCTWDHRATTGRMLACFAVHLAPSTPLSAIKQYITDVALADEERGQPDPRTSATLLSKVLQEVGGAGKPPQLPLTTTLVKLIIDQLLVKEGVVADDKIMLQAAILLGFYGFQSLDSICECYPGGQGISATAEDVTLVNHPNGECVIRFQEKSWPLVRIVYVSRAEGQYCPVFAMRTYLSRRKADTGSPGPLFRYLSGSPLTVHHLTREVRELLTAGNINPAIDFGGYSFRIGATTSAIVSGAPDWLIDGLGHWEGRSVRKYRDTELEDLPDMSSFLYRSVL
ncbi:uncharacterized protein LOC135825735 isoform X1 [Sycon ciliatum]|uniref:uncharacterized protein LOC135825735 isoform X1 n=1 Tax=Sycon ciliatum TaxID=27933 RepID=UPI0031F6BB3F